MNEDQAIMLKPEQDTQFAQNAAVILKDVVKQNGWAIKLGGKSEHLMFEAWQTMGKYYGYTVKTGESKYIEYGEIKGFEAKAWVIDNKTGIEIGGAEAACLSDEPNWDLKPHQDKWGKTIPGKPLFQLKSMAQTRAGSKALRQILGFVVALAGYSATPAEEMTSLKEQVEDMPSNYLKEAQKTFGVKDDGCICGSQGKFHRRDCSKFVKPDVNVEDVELPSETLASV